MRAPFRPRPIRSTYLILAALLLAIPSSASAAWPHQTFGYTPIAPSSGEQVLAQMVSDGAGGAYFVFTDRRSGTEEVYLQRLTATGQIAGGWPASGLHLGQASSRKLQPQMVSDGSGGVIVTWVDFGAGNSDIFVQRVLPNGTTAGGGWPSVGLQLTSFTQGERRPQICTDGAGGALIAWESPFSSTDTDVSGAHVTSSGGVTFDGFLDYASADTRQISVAPDNAGGYYVAYQDSSGLYQAKPKIFGLHANGSGTVLTGPLRIINDSDSYTDLNPHLIPDGTGAFYLARLNNDTHVNFDIYVTQHNPSMVSLLLVGGTSFGLDTPNFNTASDGTGGVLCSWKERLGHTLVARFVPSGDPWGFPYPDLGDTGLTSESPGICADGSAGMIVGYGGNGLLVQRIPANGGSVAHWGTGALVRSQGGEINVLDVTDGGHGAIMGWAEFAPNVHQIFAQRVDGFGALGNAEPAITGIGDVAGDQGGHVRLAWNSSYLDSDPYYAISSYYIWRQTPLSSAMMAVHAGARWVEEAGATARPGRLFRHSTSSAYAWEFIASQPTNGSSQYTYTAATTRDSTGASNPRTAFMVEARWSGGTAFWDSAPDSGYSVDNLAPAAPMQFTGQYASGTSALHWLRNVELDLAGYRLYRGITASFTPSVSNRVASPPDTGYVDHAGAAYYYKLSAVDVHGNESLYATLLPQGVASVPGGSPAPKLALAVVSQNPASGEATLRFDLTREGPVRLALYSASGRLVREVAAGGFAAGSWFRNWDGRDGVGALAPSGLYFAKLSAEGRAITSKVVLLR